MRPRRIVATIEARLASTRLPGKVLLPLAGAPLLQRLIERAARARCLDVLVLATTHQPEDSALADLGAALGLQVRRGPVEDVMGRLLLATQPGDLVVQLTGDNPLVDPGLIDLAVAAALAQDLDYCAVEPGSGLPIGLDLRVFRRDALAARDGQTRDPVHRVHGTTVLAEGGEDLRRGVWRPPSELARPDYRLTVDEAPDYHLMRSLFGALHPSAPRFTAHQALDWLDQNPSIAALNQQVEQKSVAAG